VLFRDGRSRGGNTGQSRSRVALEAVNCEYHRPRQGRAHHHHEKRYCSRFRHCHPPQNKRKRAGYCWQICSRRVRRTRRQRRIIAAILRSCPIYLANSSRRRVTAENATTSAKGLNLVVDPQSDQVKNDQTGKNGCPNEKRPHQPLGMGQLSLNATVHFERLFVDRRAVPILDPRRVSFTPLVLEISKRPIRVVGCKFDYPSRHEILPGSILPCRVFETRPANLNFD
jgi:hypothetical protein